MAVLTWQQVANPNFSGVNDAFRTGVQLQNNALSGIGDAIKQVRQQQLGDANAAVLQRALRVNDADQYQKALTDGTFLAGVQPGQVTPETLGALGARATTLLGQANTRQGMRADAYKQGRTELENYLSDAARGQAAQRLGLTGPLAQLSPEQQLKQVQGESTLLGSNLNNVDRAFRNVTQQRDDDVNQVGLTTATNIMRQSADRNDALAILETMNDLQPAEFAAANKLLRETYGDLYAQAQPAGANGKQGTRQGNPYDATFNFQGTSAPITSMPISDVLKVQENSLTSQGASPMGAFQINKATLEDFGPRVLGKDWKNQPFDAEAQEKVAKAIFEERKGGDLTKTWAGLTNSSPGAYKDYSWADIRGAISQGEVGQNLPDDPATLRLLTQAAQQDYGRRQSQNNSVGVTADVQRNLSDTRTTGEVAQDLIKNQYPDADTGKLVGMINKIQRDNPGLSAADAGSILTRSTRDSAWYTPGTTSIGGGVGVDDEAVAQNTLDYIRGQADRSSLANQMTAQQSQKLANAQTKYDEASQNLMALMARQQIQPGLSTERAQAAFDKAEAALKRALAEARGNPSNRPVR